VMRLIPLTFGMWLAACADTGPLSIFERSHSLFVTVTSGGYTQANQEVQDKATAFCAQKGKRMFIKDGDTGECSLHDGCGQASIDFLCLNPDDSRLYPTPTGDYWE
jgi:hypothetical protein